MTEKPVLFRARMIDILACLVGTPRSFNDIFRYFTAPKISPSTLTRRLKELKAYGCVIVEEHQISEDRWKRLYKLTRNGELLVALSGDFAEAARKADNLFYRGHV